MAQLKQSTQYTRTWFMYDSTDHITPKTGLTPTVNISKAGAAFGVAAGTVAEVANGLYKISGAGTATDTNTVGDLSYHITGTAADPAQFVDQVGPYFADVTHWSGTTVPTPDTAGYPKVTIKNGTGGGELSTTSGIVNADAVRISGDTSAADNLEAAYDGTGYGDGVTQTGNNTTTVVLATSASASNSFYNNRVQVTMIDGPAAGLSAIVTAYAGATRTATVAPTFPVSPTAGGGDKYVLSPVIAHLVTAESTVAMNITGNLSGSVGSVTGAVGSVTAGVGLSATAVDNVWDEAIAGHLTAGTTGLALSSAASAGDPWGTALPGAYGAGTAGKIIGDNVNATVSSRLASATYVPPTNFSTMSINGSGQVTVGSNSTAAKAEINAEVLDVLTVDTYAELASLPAASPTFLQKIQYLYQQKRNKKTQSSTTQTVFKNDSSTSLGTSTVADDGTTFSITRTT